MKQEVNLFSAGSGGSHWAEGAGRSLQREQRQSAHPEQQAARRRLDAPGQAVSCTDPSSVYIKRLRSGLRQRKTRRRMNSLLLRRFRAYLLIPSHRWLPEQKPQKQTVGYLLHPRPVKNPGTAAEELTRSPLGPGGPEIPRSPGIP